MILPNQRSPLLASLALFCLGLSGCQTDKHTMAEPKDGTVIVCRLCYDEVYKERHYTGSRWRTMRTDTHTRHVCPDCKTELSIYTENGVTMVRCAKCAPEGLACDKCLPPKDYTPPKTADESATK